MDTLSVNEMFFYAAFGRAEKKIEDCRLLILNIIFQLQSYNGKKKSSVTRTSDKESCQNKSKINKSCDFIY